MLGFESFDAIQQLYIGMDKIDAIQRCYCLWIWLNARMKEVK